MTNYREHLTYHAEYERKWRMDYIEANIGFGEPLVKSWNSKRKSWHEITDTGIMVIRGANGIVITMYIANEKEVLTTYKMAGRSVVPVALMNKIRKNQKHEKWFKEWEQKKLEELQEGD